MNSENYCEKIVSLIEGEISERPWLSLMQDNTPPHTALQTMRVWREKNTCPTIWPAFSPGLNPIEAVWNSMKDFIQSKYPDLGGGRTRTLHQLRVIVREAWNLITSEVLSSLLLSTSAESRIAVKANGGSTKY